jgi:hypothetical protein
MRYIQDHWSGRRSLFWSFWINLVLLRFAILYFDQFTHPPFLEKSLLAVILSAGYFLVFNVLVFSWQIRGLIKASDRYVSEYGSQIMAMASHFGIVFCLLFTGFSIHDAYQSLFVEDRANRVNKLSWSHSLLGEYTIRVRGRDLYLSGDFRVGVTEALTKVLDLHSEINRVVLSSNGGRVVEGRGLAQLFRKRQLNTLVMKECKSACTTAFIGGNRRFLGPDGKLGFHQFSLDGVYHNPYVDPQSEQKIDLDFYASQGINETFLKDVFQASHREMWFPEPENLVAAGVVHQILAEIEVSQ